MTQLEILKKGLEESGPGYTEFASEEVGHGPDMIYIVPGRYKVPKDKAKFFKGLLESESCIEFDKEGRFRGI